jgi:hypothetical protein
LDDVRDKGVSGNATAHYEYIGGRVLKRTCKEDACVERFVLYARRELCYFAITVAQDG